MDNRKYAMIYWNQIGKKPTLLVDATLPENCWFMSNATILRVETLFNETLMIPVASIQYIHLFELDSGSEYDRIVNEKDPEIILLYKGEKNNGSEV